MHVDRRGTRNHASEEVRKLRKLDLSILPFLPIPPASGKRCPGLVPSSLPAVLPSLLALKEAERRDRKRDRHKETEGDRERQRETVCARVRVCVCARVLVCSAGACGREMAGFGARVDMVRPRSLAAISPPPPSLTWVSPS